MKSSLIAFVFTFISIGLFGQVIPFQGKLTENGVPVNGTKNFIFTITDVSWTETHTGVQVTDGLYSVDLGSVNAFPTSLFGLNDSHQLDINVSGVALTAVTLQKPTIGNAVRLNSDDGSYSFLRQWGLYLNSNWDGTSQNAAARMFYNANGGQAMLYSGQGYDSGTPSQWLGNVGQGGYQQLLGYDGGGNVTGALLNGFWDGSGLPHLYMEDAAEVPQVSLKMESDGTNHWGWLNLNNNGQNTISLSGSDGVLTLTTPDGLKNLVFDPSVGLSTTSKFEVIINDGAENENITARFESSGPGDGTNGSYNIGLRSDAANNTWGNVGLTGYATGTVGTDNAGGTFFSQVNDGSTTIANKGIYATANGSGLNYGVYGQANGGVENWAGWFQGDVKITGNLSLDGSNSFDSNSGVGQDAYDDQVTQSLNVGGDGDGRHFGLLINASSTNGRQNKGIRADASGPGNTGPTGSTVNAGGEFFAQDNIQNNIGVQGVAWGTTGENNYGGLFYGTTTDPAGTNYGIFSEASGAGTNWAGWFEGDVRLTSSLILDDAGYSRLEKRPEGGFLQLAGDNGSVTGAILSGFWAGNPLPQFLMEDENSGPGVYFAMENDVTNFGRFMLNNIDGGAQTTIDLNGKNGDITALGEVNGSIFRANDFSLGNGKAHIFSGNNGNGDFGLLDLESPSGADNRISMGFNDVSEESGFISIWKNNGGGTDEYALLNVASGGPGGALFGSLFLKDDLGNSVGVNGFGDISATGEINGNTLVSSDGSVQTSDRRYKMNIKHLENSLENTLKLRGVSYNWIDPKKSESNQIGVIAQEVEEVYPEFVKTLKDGYKAVNYAQMVAVLIEAVKELNTKITNLENENTQLKASLAKSEENKQKIDNLQSQLTGILKLLENSKNDENVTTSED